MLVPVHFLLLLLLLGGPSTGLSHHYYKAKPLFSCLNTALSEVKKGPPEDALLMSKRSFHYLPVQDPSSGEEEEAEEKEERKDKERRTFPGSRGGGGAGSARYKYLSQLRGKLDQDKVKSDRHTKFTLSLDVPTNIMNILFNIAKAKNLQAKAAANAHLSKVSAVLTDCHYMPKSGYFIHFDC
ncbi:urocortin-3-like [Tupaia chinensis]|uniref:urocortin-3-like n=1 Tax=Tupaia chinensis TaxID=246437 RepID=UPI0003C9229B|nr:urocortin-3-like [Tupaia chinensis]